MSKCDPIFARACPIVRYQHFQIRFENNFVSYGRALSIVTTVYKILGDLTKIISAVIIIGLIVRVDKIDDIDNKGR
jgi:hypothetical protein